MRGGGAAPPPPPSVDLGRSRVSLSLIPLPSPRSTQRPPPTPPDSPGLVCTAPPLTPPRALWSGSGPPDLPTRSRPSGAHRTRPGLPGPVPSGHPARSGHPVCPDACTLRTSALSRHVVGVPPTGTPTPGCVQDRHNYRVDVASDAL